MGNNFCTPCFDDPVEKSFEKQELSKDNINVDADLQKQAKEFTLNRNFYKKGDEYEFRVKNDKDIQNRRWQWYQDNSKLFSLILQNNGFDLEDINSSFNGTKPLGMKIDLFNDFKNELFKYVDIAENRINKEIGKVIKLRIVLQGSYTVGYSSNPRKGDRYIPNYLFDPSKNSDYDFRCYADGLDIYVDKLRNNGIKIGDLSDRNKGHVIHPESVKKVIPEFEELMNKFKELTLKHLGKNIRLQITLLTKNINFEPNPWNMEISK